MKDKHLQFELYQITAMISNFKSYILFYFLKNFRPMKDEIAVYLNYIINCAIKEKKLES